MGTVSRVETQLSDILRELGEVKEMIAKSNEASFNIKGSKYGVKNLSIQRTQNQ